MKVRFANITLDSDSRQLVRDGETVHLSPKAFDLLCHLIEKRPNVVSKNDLHAHVWPGTFVVDAALTGVMAELRKALGDDAQTPRFIRTVHRYGYAFCAEATDLSATPLPASQSEHVSAPKVWLMLNDRVLPLIEGENVIGRDPASSVWLDVAGVSRRHARIVVTGERAAIEDLGSKNGTSIGNAPVTAPRLIVDGEVIQIGPVALRFRMWSRAHPVETERLSK